jgi:hypothetical protein
MIDRGMNRHTFHTKGVEIICSRFPFDTISYILERNKELQRQKGLKIHTGEI